MPSPWAVPVTLTQLKVFLAVVEAGSVRAAAERLFVAQPSVSAAVGSLERELGVALVARQGRGLRVTEAGLAFAADVRQGLNLIDRGGRRARAAEAPGQGEVRLTAVTTAAERLLLPLLARFKREHPVAGVALQVGNRTTVWEALRDYEADLVVAGRPPVGLPAVVVAVAENRLVLVGSPGAAPAGRAARPAELAGATWLLREEGSGTREATEQLLERLGLRPPTMILGSNGAIEEAAAEGLGVALLSRHAVAASLRRGRLAEIACPHTPLDRPWHLVAHGREPLSPTALLLARSMTGSGAPGGFVPTPAGRALLATKVEPAPVREPAG